MGFGFKVWDLGLGFEGSGFWSLAFVHVMGCLLVWGHSQAARTHACQSVHYTGPLSSGDVIRIHEILEASLAGATHY